LGSSALGDRERVKDAVVSAVAGAADGEGKWQIKLK
jgi:hypothetical protein